MYLWAFEVAFASVLSLGWCVVIVRGMMSGAYTMRRPVFVAVLCAACLVGMAGKLDDFVETGGVPPLFWLYTIDFMLAFVDMRLIERANLRRGAGAEAAATTAAQAVEAPAPSEPRRLRFARPAGGQTGLAA